MKLTSAIRRHHRDREPAVGDLSLALQPLGVSLWYVPSWYVPSRAIRVSRPLVLKQRCGAFPKHWEIGSFQCAIARVTT
jgi:hypothetical protein